MKLPAHHLHLVTWLRTCGSVPPLHHLSSCHGAELSIETTLPYLLHFIIFLGLMIYSRIILEMCTNPIWIIHFPEAFCVQWSPYLMNLWGKGFSYTELRFSLNVCYAELCQAIVYNYDKIIFFCRNTWTTFTEINTLT